ncbi:MAG: L-histidine N(alpha)-methyltransferase [Gemmatimonadota bacterium]|nr:L-histidine N(alpha)-methyltransferase [Gemmatimonadota bacterium]MDH5760756.1 L-histidine N(alpha)-methyltransferase [Gemmatimonadota bacterium]
MSGWADRTSSSRAFSEMLPTGGVGGAASHGDESRLEMLEDVIEGLSRTPKMIPPKYFYDEKGSRLFDEITRLDEYYLTRAETALMEEHAREIAGEIGPGALIIEPGSGSSAKTRILLDALIDPVGYVPVDISGAYLEQVAAGLRLEYPAVPILPLAADFTEPLDALPEPPRPPTRRIVYFPGSTIGNFTELEAERLLTRMRRMAGAGGGVLVGFDLLKSVEVLLPAYDDAAGVTARFNLNLLARLNAELGADFDLCAFRHQAPFNEAASRMEMHLVSVRSQEVRVGGRTFAFGEGERLVTEYSYKYAPEAFAALAASAGLAARRSWTDAGGLFCVQLLVPEDAAGGTAGGVPSPAVG